MWIARSVVPILLALATVALAGQETPQLVSPSPSPLVIRKAHVAAFNYALLSPDRATLVTVDVRGGVARVWDFPVGILRNIFTLEAPIFSPFGKTCAFLDNRRLLLGESTRVRVVDIASGAITRDIPLPNANGAWRIRFVLDFPEGALFVVGRNTEGTTNRAELLLMDADSTAVVARFPVEFTIETAALFGEGLLAVIGSDISATDLSRKAKIFRGDRLQLLKTLDGVGFFETLRLLQGHETYSALSLKDDDQTAAENYSLLGQEADPKTAEKLPVGEPVDGSFGASFPDQNTLLTPSRWHVSLWDLPARRVLHKIRVREAAGYLFTQALLDETGGVLRLGTARYSIPGRTLTVPEGIVHAVDLDCAWTEDSTDLSYGCSESTPASLLEWVKAELGEEYTGVMPFLTRSPNRRFLAQTLPGYFVVWDMKTGKPVIKQKLTLPGYLHDVAIFSPDESSVLLLPGTRTEWPKLKLDLGTPDPKKEWPARLFTLPEGKEAGLFTVVDTDTLPELYEIAAFSPNGHVLALGTAETITLVDTSTSKVTRSLHCRARALEFLDERTLLIATADGTFSRLMLPDGVLEPGLARSDYGVPVSLRRSVAGRFLTSTSADGVVETWRIPAFEKVLTSVLLPGGNWVHLAPDGRFDASEDAGDYLGWRTADGVQPFKGPACRPKDQGLLGGLFGAASVVSPQEVTDKK